MCIIMYIVYIHNVYFYFVDGIRFLAINFRNSLSEAVLKFYPGAVEASNVSSLCLSFNVFISSRAVELLIAVSDVSEDNKEFPSDNSESYPQQVGMGVHTVTVLRGWQYVVFTAKKIKATRTPDRVEVKHIWFREAACRNDATGMYRHIKHACGN